MTLESVPGKGPASNEAELKSDLQSKVDSLKARLLINPQHVAKAKFKFKDEASIFYLANNQRPDVWQIESSFRIENTDFTSSFGTRINEATRELESYATRPVTIEPGNDFIFNGSQAANIISGDFDLLMIPPTPYNQPRPGGVQFDIQKDAKGKITIDRTDDDSWQDGYSNLFGEEGLQREIEDSSRFLAQLKQRELAQKPFLQEITGLKSKIDEIANPDSHFNTAEIWLKNGTKIDYYTGEARNIPPFWHIYVRSFDTTIGLTFNGPKANWIRYHDRSQEGPNCRIIIYSPVRNGDRIEREGIAILPEVDAFLSANIPS